MYKDFEAKTEAEAISLAIEDLHIGPEDFEVEVLDNGKRGLFKRGNVKIRVHVEGPENAGREEDYSEVSDPAGFGATEAGGASEEEKKSFGDARIGDGAYSGPHGEALRDNGDSVFYGEAALDEDAYRDEMDPEDEDDSPVLEVDEDLERKVCAFVEGVVEKMGFQCEARVGERRGRKIYVNIDSADSNIIIGRKGRNLDAIQVLANVYMGNFDDRRKVIVDTEMYRVRHEESIVKSAYRVASQVKKTGRSRLLEPMNPYERRLVHTALSDVTGIDTKSEGTGLLKQIRIIAKRRY